MAKSTKTVKTNSNTPALPDKEKYDNVYSRGPYKATDDEFGKRDVKPDTKRKLVSKAGKMSEKDGAKGMPGAPSAVEDEAFEKAYDRISKLNKGDPDHGF